MNKFNLKVFGFVILIVLIYSFFIATRPYEDDEAAYIRAGQAIINGELNPFKYVRLQHFSNPFQYMLGSPLVPIIYGFVYQMGGVVLVRLVSLIATIASLYIVFIIIRKANGNLLPLLILSLSSATILISSNGFLDSVALFFFVLSIYFFIEEKMLIAGIVGGISIISKFILSFPLLLFALYLFKYKKDKKLFAGMLMILIPFTILYFELIPSVVGFILFTKFSDLGFLRLKYFLDTALMTLPLLSLICLYMYSKGKILKGKFLMILIGAILFYQIISLDFISLARHLPYVEFSAAILIGMNVKNININKTILYIIIGIFAYFSFVSALAIANSYPSYKPLSVELKNLNGKVLVAHPNVYALVKELPINATQDQLFSYFYFDYNGKQGSDIEIYKEAIKDGFFDYAVVSSFSSPKFPIYMAIENLVRDNYCLIERNKYGSGIDIYKRCDKS